MANKYWVGGSGNWSDNTNHWSDSDGGSPGAAKPTSSDNVIFNGNSGTGTVTINETANCLDFDMSTSSILTVAGSSALNVYGSFTLIAGLTWSKTSNLYFRSTTTGKTITTAGVSMNPGSTAFINFEGNGGGWQLQDDLKANSYVYHNYGHLDLNGHTVDLVGYYSTSSSARTLTCSGSKFIIRGGSFSISKTNFTLNNSTPANFDFYAGYFTGADYTWGDIVFKPDIGNYGFSSPYGTTLIPTLANLTIETPNTRYVTEISLGCDIVVTGTFTCNGKDDSHRIYIFANNDATRWKITAATVSISYSDISDLEGAGAGTWSGTNLGDGGNNAGITFASPRTLYWVGNGGNWYDTAHWSLSDDGSSGEAPPRPQDDVNFTANSIKIASQTVYIRDMRTIGNNVDFSNIANSPTVYFNYNSTNTQVVHGSLTLASGMTVSGYSYYNLRIKGRVGETHTITSAGKQFPMVFTILGPGTINLADDLYIAGYYLTLGGGYLTFDANDQDINAAGFSSSSTLHSTIYMGNGTWTMRAGGSYGWNFSGSQSNMTLYCEQSTIVFAQDNQNFYGGGKNFYDLEITGDNASFSQIYSGHFHNITLTPGKTVKFGGWDDIYIDNDLIAIGSAGSIITIISTSSGSPNRIHKSGGGTIRCDYLSLKDSNADGGAWYAGINSTIVSGVTGWVLKDNPEKTVTAKARIKRGGMLQTVQAKANIFNTVTQTVQAKAKIVARSTKTATAKARIRGGQLATIQAKANIFATATKTVQAKADIKVPDNLVTVTAKAKICVAKPTQTVQAKAWIKGIVNQSVQAKANIKGLGVTQTVQAKALIDAHKRYYVGNEGHLGYPTDPNIVNYPVSNYNASLIIKNATQGRVGQQFYRDNTGYCTNSKIYAKKVGNPTGTLAVYVYYFSGGHIYEEWGAYASGSIDVSTLPTDFDLVDIPMNGGYISSNYYGLVIRYEGGDDSNYVEIGYDNSGNYSYGDAYHYTGGAWTLLNNQDLIFYLEQDSYDEDHWAYESGGDPIAPTPTQYDDVIFDENSFTEDDQTVYIKSTLYCKNFDMSAVTHQPTIISGGGWFYIDCYGNFTLGDVVWDDSAGNGEVTFYGPADGTPHYLDMKGIATPGLEVWNYDDDSETILLSDFDAYQSYDDSGYLAGSGTGIVTNNHTIRVGNMDFWNNPSTYGYRIDFGTSDIYLCSPWPYFELWPDAGGSPAITYNVDHCNFYIEVPDFFQDQNEDYASIYLNYELGVQLGAHWYVPAGGGLSIDGQVYGEMVFQDAAHYFLIEDSYDPGLVLGDITSNDTLNKKLLFGNYYADGYRISVIDSYGDIFIENAIVVNTEYQNLLGGTLRFGAGSVNATPLYNSGMFFTKTVGPWWHFREEFNAALDPFIWLEESVSGTPEIDEVSGGVYHQKVTDGYKVSRDVVSSIEEINFLDNTAGITVQTRFKGVSNNGQNYGVVILSINDDKYYADLSWKGTDILFMDGISTETISDVDATEYHVYRVTINGTVKKLYIDDVLKATIDNISSEGARGIHFGSWDSSTGTNEAYWDYIYWRIGVYAPDQDQGIQAKARIKSSGTLQTVSAKARIKIPDQTVTVTAKSRIKQVAVETSIDAKARIKSSGTVQTVRAKARIFKESTKTITAKARVKQLDNTKTITAKARIKGVGTLQTVTAKARIAQKGRLHDISAKARIKGIGTTKTISAKARIVSRSETSISAKARILVKQLKTVTAKARIKGIGTLKTVSAKARIKILDNTKTVAAKARIKILDGTNTISAKASILVRNLTTVEARARIKRTFDTTITAKARIKRLATLQTISAKSRIKSTGEIQTVEAKARIKQVSNEKTISARARIKIVNNTNTISAKARVLQHREKTISAKARIQSSGVIKTIQSKARIKRIGVIKTITSKARILVRTLVTVTAKALIVARKKWYVNRPVPFKAGSPKNWYSKNTPGFSTKNPGNWYEDDPKPFETPDES